jgi:hypothetical protein
MKPYRGVKVRLFPFSTSALNMVNGQFYILVAFPLGKSLLFAWNSTVSTRASLDIFKI